VFAASQQLLVLGYFAQQKGGAGAGFGGFAADSN
jgi:hypothetical protein